MLNKIGCCVFPTGRNAGRTVQQASLLVTMQHYLLTLPAGRDYFTGLWRFLQNTHTLAAAARLKKPIRKVCKGK